MLLTLGDLGVLELIHIYIQICLLESFACSNACPCGVGKLVHGLLLFFFNEQGSDLFSGMDYLVYALFIG